MSKYIIEIEDEPFVRLSALFGEEGLYRAKGFNSLVFDQFGLDKLTPLDKELEEAYQRGYEVGSHEATTLEFQRGLDCAWEAITKIAKMPDGERMTHFGEVWISNILNAYSLDQIFTILKKSEFEPDEIKVGDEVEAYSGRAIVFGTFTDVKGNKVCNYWYPSEYRFDRDKTKNLKKTGKHFPQVAELFKAIKGERSCSSCEYQNDPDGARCRDCCGYNKWEPKEGAE